MTALMDGYIRVSQVAGRSGERFQSPDQQRDAITAWARANGVRIAAWHQDLDVSGGTMDRPGMNAAIERIDAGVTGGLVVARLDRFARTLSGGLALIERLHAQGARVACVAEPIDPATPLGRATLGLLLTMAQWQRDQADESFGLAMRRATDAGRYPTKPSLGYRKTADGLIEVDEESAETVRLIFTWRAAGVGWRKICDDLHRLGRRSALGGEFWAPSTLIGIVRSESPLGVFVGPRGLRVENAWPALVDRELWERANAVRGVRDNARLYEDRLFAGIARCATCRYVLVRAVNPHGFVSYACGTRGCTGRGSVGANLLDQHLTVLVDERLARIQLLPDVAGDDGEGDLLAAARDAAVRELEAWRDDLGLRSALGDHDWRQGIIARASARDEAEAELAAYRRRGLGAVVDLPAGRVPALDDLPWPVRRQVVDALVHSVWLRRSPRRGPAARQHLAERVHVVWADERELPELPAKGRMPTGPVRWPGEVPTRTARRADEARRR